MSEPGDEELLRFTVGPEDAGLTLLSFLADRFVDAPSASLRRLVQGEEVVVGGQAAGPRQTLAAGDVVEVWPEYLERIEPAPLEGFAVLHEEPGLLACAKPAGVPVEPGRGEVGRPFRAALLEHLARRGVEARPRLVHRLDRDTTGVVLVATSRATLRELTRQFEEREVTKEYLALVRGAPREDSGTIDQPLARRGRRGQDEGPLKPAVTRWEVAERFRRHALLRCRPETGRQHQLRQHLAALGHPLAVDPEYGGARRLLLSELKPGRYRARRGREERPLVARQTLHARRLTYRSPVTGAEVLVEAPVPQDLEVTLKQLRKYDAV